MRDEDFQLRDEEFLLDGIVARVEAARSDCSVHVLGSFSMKNK